LASGETIKEEDKGLGVVVAEGFEYEVVHDSEERVEAVGDGDGAGRG
jgi:hypothetical protein